MPAKPQWRIYYTDGSTFDDTQGEASGAPPLGIICIVQRREDGLRFVMQGFNWYYWHKPSRQWWGSDLTGVLDQFLHFPDDVTALKMGRNVPDDKYREIHARAVNDKDLSE